MMIRWGSFEDKNGIYKEVALRRSYELALQTWSDWLETQIDRAKTKLFFISMSPTHERYTPLVTTYYNFAHPLAL